jgi:predicted neuraminidase
MQKEFIIENLPTDFCHASTVIKTPDGLLSCWFGGTHEGKADVAIWSSRKADGKWTAPVKLSDGVESNWNPVLFYNEQGKLHLFYKEGQQISDWKTYLMTSDDNGKIWSEPCEMVAGDVSGGRGPVRNKPITLSNGYVVAGGSIEKGIWSAFVDVSTDGCVAWEKSAPIEIAGLMYNAGEKTAESNIAVSEQSFYGRGVIQPSLWESAAGKVHMLLRSSEGYVYRADSEDYGKTWSDAYKTELPNNNSGLDLVKAPFDGNLYLVCNPVQANWGMRSPLSLFKSEDNGVTWNKLYDLESEPGEFSYPAIIASEEGLTITYTWNRKNIACVSLDKEELV